MLDREVVKELVIERLKETGNTPIPKNINKQELIEAFCQFTEDDYYEWIKDNFQAFFNHGDPDWEWIENYIKKTN
jgi:hypothetical protein